MTDIWLALASGVGGVLLGSLVTGIFNLVGPSIQSRREHKRRLREARLTAYSDFLAAIDLWMESNSGRWLEDRVRLDD
jgi:hypothetical protein